MKDKKENRSNRQKVFVIGLDGATFDLIRPWALEGKLPNLDKIMHTGAYGELASTIPTNSAPAWTSFVTGTNPGRHGILHFKTLGYQTREYMLNRHSRKCKAIWNILSEQGRKVGIVNVPLTYPPEKVNGFLISGMDTPSRSSSFTYPDGLYQELKEALGDYQIEAQVTDLVRIRNDKDRKRLVDAVMHTTELRLAATKYLMAKYPWDFFLVVFMAADRFQHRFWKYMDSTHPHYNVKEAGNFGHVIFEAYRRLDQVVGEISKRLDDRTTLMIMSDHGFGPAPVKSFNMNNWLASKGLLHYKGKDKGEKAFNLHSFILNHLQLYTPITLRHYLRRKFRSTVDKFQMSSRLNGIDWETTKAYSDEHVEIFSTIWINLKGREPHGTVAPGNEYENLRNHIIGMLKDLKDPDSNQTMVEKVYTTEEAFRGEKNNTLPDLMVKWKDAAYRTQSAFTGMNESQFIGRIDAKQSSQTISGEHKKNGIFLIKGPNIKKGNEITGAEITDLMPTILHRMGISVPRQVDGQVLADIFEKDYLSLRPVRYDEKDTMLNEEGKADTFSEAENKKVRERLAALGYLE